MSLMNIYICPLFGEKLETETKRFTSSTLKSCVYKNAD